MVEGWTVGERVGSVVAGEDVTGFKVGEAEGKALDGPVVGNIVGSDIEGFKLGTYLNKHIALRYRAI